MPSYTVPYYPTLHSSEKPTEAGYYLTVDASGGSQIGYWSPSRDHLMLLGSDPNRNGLDDEITDWYGKLQFPHSLPSLEKEKEDGELDSDRQ